MDLAVLDASLAKAEQDAAAMSGNLLALEETPAFALIKHTTFTGVTAARFGAALDGLGALWERAAAFSSTVAEARRLRDEQRHPSRERLAELQRLLSAPVVAVGAPGAASGLTGRTIFGAAAAGNLSLTELAAQLTSGYDQLAEAVRTIDTAWQQQLPALQALDTDLRAVAADAGSLGLDVDRELGDLPGRVRHVLTEATTDPLGQAPQAEQLQRDVAAVRQRLVALTAQRDGLPAELADARRELVNLRLLLTRGAQAAERAVARVRDPAGLRAPLDADRLDAPAPEGLGPCLERIEHLTGGWMEQRRALDGWTARARALHAQADAVARANEAPVAARDELRGRLESYRAMAGAHGAAEDTALGDLFDRAHDALHTAPADLRTAAPLVVQYVAAVRARVQHAGGARSPRGDQTA